MPHPVLALLSFPFSLLEANSSNVDHPLGLYSIFFGGEGKVDVLRFEVIFDNLCQSRTFHPWEPSFLLIHRHRCTLIVIMNWQGKYILWVSDVSSSVPCVEWDCRGSGYLERPRAVVPVRLW